MAASYATDHGLFFNGLDEQPPVHTGLDCALFGWRAFANPPYTQGFLDKAVDSMIARRAEADIIVALLPAATETRWFQKLWPVSHVEFLPQRVRFIHPPHSCGERCTPDVGTHVFGKPGASPPGGHMISILRPEMPPR